MYTMNGWRRRQNGAGGTHARVAGMALCTWLWTVLVGAVVFGAEEPRGPKLVKVVTQDTRLMIAEIQEETPERLLLYDLAGGKPVLLEKAAVNKLERDVSEEEAVKWAGLPAYLAWRLKGIQDTAGRVVRVVGPSVYVNLGKKDGIEAGTKLEAYRQGDVLTDPETGEALGRARTLVAELSPFEIEEKLSKCGHLSKTDTMPEPGDLVSPVRSGRAVAVLPICDLGGKLTPSSRMLAEQIMTTFAQRGVHLVEREKMDQVLAELAAQQTFLFDPKTAAGIGKQVGAYAVLTGTVGPARGKGAEAHIRVVRVSTGEVLLAASGELAVQPSTEVEGQQLVVQVMPSGRRVNLLALVDPARDSVSGAWKLKDGALASSGVERERIEFRYVPPAEYDFCTVFSKGAGEGSTLQILQKAGHPFAWVMGGDYVKCGFEMIGGKAYTTNPTLTMAEDLRLRDRRHTSVIQVRNGGLRAYLNGRLIAEWRTNYMDMTLSSKYALRDPRFLGLATFRDRGVFHVAEVIEVTGTGTVVPR